MNRGTQIRRSVLFFLAQSVDPPLFSFKSGSALLDDFLLYSFTATECTCYFYDVFFLLRCFTYYYLFMESKKLYLKRVMLFFPPDKWNTPVEINSRKLFRLGAKLLCNCMCCETFQKTVMFNLFIGYQIHSN